MTVLGAGLPWPWVAPGAIAVAAAVALLLRRRQAPAAPGPALPAAVERAARRKLFLTYASPRNVLRSIRLLFKGDTALWYTSLGDEVLEGMDGAFDDPKKALWLNIGYWKEARTYPDACVAMAVQLAEAAALEASDEVLDVGFGYGEQDLLWHDRYGVAKITGLNITPLHVDVARRRVRERGLEDRIDLRLGSATEMPFADGSFDKVLALECAFHFDTRETFFDEAFRVLKPGGRLALTDMIPLPGRSGNRFSSWFMRQRSGWPAANLYDRGVYAAKLREHGFVGIRCDSIRGHVYPGMYKYIMQRYAGLAMEEIAVEVSDAEVEACAGADLWQTSMGISDYVLVAADKPPAPAP